jgi:ubiquitin-like 1-activating enzyme E1 A
MKRERDDARESSSKVLISEADAKLYDRQIRLWGAASQQKIFESRVLAVGVSGVVAEALKNLALAGVGHVEVIDDTIVSESDIGPNLLIGRESIGHNRAAACVERLRELNPRVQVTIDERSAAALDADFVARFDVVLCSAINVRDAVCLNNAVRTAGRGSVFFATAAQGRGGFVFCDASKHVYRAEGSETQVLIEQMPSFAEVSQSAPLTGKRASSQVLELQLLWRFQTRHGRLPNDSEDEKIMTDIQENMYCL